MKKDELIYKVISQITSDAEFGYYSAIFELLELIPEENLRAFLPEEENLDIQIDEISNINE
jgi:hypothetical protein